MEYNQDGTEWCEIHQLNLFQCKKYIYIMHSINSTTGYHIYCVWSWTQMASDPTMNSCLTKIDLFNAIALCWRWKAPWELMKCRARMSLVHMRFISDSVKCLTKNRNKIYVKLQSKRMARLMCLSSPHNVNLPGLICYHVEEW